MKFEEKLVEIENLLANLYNNSSLLQEKLLDKYENDINDEQYLNDSNFIKYLNKTICEFLGNE